MKIINLRDLQQQPLSHNLRIKKQVLLDYEETGNISTLAQAVFPPGEKVEEHFHEDLHEIFMIKSGSGTITIDEKEFDLKAGITAVVEAGERHALENTGRDELVIQYFGIIIKDTE